MQQASVVPLTSRRIPAIRPLADIVEDAQRGLTRRPRSMPPKYFYDERGSRLFDAICETSEYYPTRTEEALLKRYAPEIIAEARPAHILEFGSGTARKTRHLLDAWEAQGPLGAYWPFDVCEPMLLESGEQLISEFPGLQVNPLVGDYLGGLAGLPDLAQPCLFLFLGGTIGNFTPAQAQTFLREARAVMKAGDSLLLGADRVKREDVLHAAYNDREGITAEFNLNLLRVLNRELEADFQLECFAHKACFNPQASQIEMYLVSRCEQSVRVEALERTLEFDAGEEILTEISRKFTRTRLEDLLVRAGFSIARHFEPDNGYFSLLLAHPA